jgi:hypothetical protein
LDRFRSAGGLTISPRARSSLFIDPTVTISPGLATGSGPQQQRIGNGADGAVGADPDGHDTTATVVNPGFFPSIGPPYRTSRQDV